jgi:YD repeat-containing protein
MITYTYDSAGQMTGAADAYATLTIAYDNDGRVGTLATSGPGTGQPTVTLTYGYDQLGDETSVKDSLSSQGLTSYVYDSDRRLTLITTSYSGTAGPQISFNYDPGSRLTSTLRQIGSSTTATEVNTTITYNAANRVVTATSSSSVYHGFFWSTTPLATQVYNYDNASRLTAETDAKGTASFTYDSAYELTGATGSRSESYSCDLNGNRNRTGYHTTVMNEMSTAPGHTYTYDNAGNLASDNNGSAITTYSYDYAARDFFAQHSHFAF